MPNFDGTGPSGQGPLTGRRRGRCRDTQTAKTEKLEIKTVENKETTYGFGRGGRSRGGSRGRGQSGKNRGIGKNI
ncbi:MAG: DUF5320 domain-containing protein [Ignavibacteriaceae bacterium]|nr:DUF5320 domain-containing protein [Ignavibacteriaceae bacterium]